MKSAKVAAEEAATMAHNRRIADLERDNEYADNFVRAYKPPTNADEFWITVRQAFHDGVRAGREDR